MKVVDASAYIPDGSFTLSKRPAAFPTGVWGQAISGDGPYVFMEDGRRMLDCMCALGALTVGHRHPHVTKAITEQVRRGLIFSMPSVLEAEVAERLCDVIPCAEKIRVVKTGSEACSAAVRIARLATGRNVILTTKSSYHGWHDGMIAARESHPGVPNILEELIVPFEYNDLVGFEEAIAIAKDLSNALPAAVILEPVQGEPPKDHFLQRLSERARRDGILVIFDEMLCGGRLALAGAQAFYDVEPPDLATFGKALGGGMPFAFVAGSTELMQHAWPVSGTFSGDAVSLAAANATLDVYHTEPVIARLWQNGTIIREALAQASKDEGATIIIYGHDPRFWLSFPGADERLAKSVFVQQCARDGVLVHPAVIFANAAMERREAETVAEIMSNALRVVLRGIRDGNLATLLVGAPYQDSVR